MAHRPDRLDVGFPAPADQGDQAGDLPGLAAVRQNDTLIAASQRAAQILGAATPAGARFGVAAEFLLLVNAPLRQVMEQWKQDHADRNTRAPLPE